jgi:Fic family protein
METLLKALENSEELINFTLQKAKLFDDFKTQFNERQSKVLKKMLEEGTKGFEGGMNAKKYMRITKTSKSTATRDLQKLNEMGIFKPSGKGRTTSYKIQFID